MKTMFRAALSGLILAGAAGFAAQAFPIKAGQGSYSDPGITDDTIKIGLFAPLSGAALAYGEDPLNAARMWYDMINGMGGIWGRKIELVIEDDRCNANDLVAAVKKLVEQDKVFMLNGGSCSAAAVAAQEYVTRAKVPYMMLNASGDGALYPPTDYIFGAASISQRAAGGTTVDFATRHLKGKKIGYINHDDAYGAWNLETAQFTAKETGATLSVESINPNITDVTAPMLKIRAANPDVLILTTYARPATLIVKKAHELGMKMPIVLAVTGTANLKQLVENVGTKDAFRNFYVQDVINDTPTGPKQKWVIDMYKKRYPEMAAKPDHPTPYMPYGIPSAQTVTNALLLAGPNPTREGVARIMRSLTFESGVMAGLISYGDNDRAGQESSIFLKFDGDKQDLQPGTYVSRWVYKP